MIARFASFVLILGLCLATTGVQAEPYTIQADSIYKHVAAIADDSLEGRLTGEIGEWKAAEYLIKEFTSMGLIPAGDNDTWRGGFEFTKKIDVGPATRLRVNGVELAIDTEFKPMLQSASETFSFDEIIPVGYGITDESGFYDDYENKDVAGKAVLIARYAPAEDNPHVDFDKYSSLADKIRVAQENKATGVFFYTPLDHDDTLPGMTATRVNPKDIPIVYLRRAAFEKLGQDLTDPKTLRAEGAIELVRVRDTGYNVMAALPGPSDTTIIFGAHYDHLGYGGPGSGSRYMGSERLVHNGADDNGSGTAALVEIARYFSTRRDQIDHSMLFVAFSGEEMGLLGSSHIARSLPEDFHVRMMINMDMIGRLRDQDKGLAIFGTHTAVQFAEYFDTLTNEDIHLAMKESGTGPSDHTAFYNQGIPVLGFFTGAHQDYHKPEDDLELIDPDGIVRVANLVTGIAEHFDHLEGPLEFQKTKDPDAGKRQAAFSVTLGIMPDYISEVVGLRVDGVSPDRPGDRAGLLAGDVIKKMDKYEIDDIYAYMNALGKFRKGDSIIVVVERDSTMVDLNVVFE